MIESKNQLILNIVTQHARTQGSTAAPVRRPDLVRPWCAYGKRFDVKSSFLLATWLCQRQEVRAVVLGFARAWPGTDPLDKLLLRVCVCVCVCVCVWLQARPPKVRGPTMSPYTVLVPARVLELGQEGTAGRACTLRRRPL